MNDLSLFKVGTPVSTIRTFQVDTEMSINGKVYHPNEYVHDVLDYGHVVRFSRNCVGEIVVVVDWANGDRTPIHPSNLNII